MPLDFRPAVWKAGDTTLRPLFYGECTLCKDTTNWVTMRKQME